MILLEMRWSRVDLGDTLTYIPQRLQLGKSYAVLLRRDTGGCGERQGDMNSVNYRFCEVQIIPDSALV
jgi:hypothetical protein